MKNHFKLPDLVKSVENGQFQHSLIILCGSKYRVSSHSHLNNTTSTIQIFFFKTPFTRPEQIIQWTNFLHVQPVYMERCKSVADCSTVYTSSYKFLHSFSIEMAFLDLFSDWLKLLH